MGASTVLGRNVSPFQRARMSFTSTPGRNQGSPLPLLLSPIHRITSRLPSQKRSSFVSPAPPAAKKLKPEDVLRREVLVKRVLSQVGGVRLLVLIYRRRLEVY